MNEEINQQTISLCIPRIECTITKEFIIKTFNNLNIGNIEKLKEIPLRNDIKHKRILLTLKINNSEDSLLIKERIEKDETIKIVYDMPWYWKVQGTKEAKDRS
jgi:hypothetical protein